jgi:hypothetical protein
MKRVFNIFPRLLPVLIRDVLLLAAIYGFLSPLFSLTLPANTSYTGEYYRHDGTFLKTVGYKDGSVYIFTDDQMQLMVKTDVETLKQLTLVVYSETTNAATWQQKAGIAETVINRAILANTPILTAASNAQWYRGLINARGQQLAHKMASIYSAEEAPLQLDSYQQAAWEAVILAMRGVNITHGATGFDGYSDLKNDYHKVQVQGLNTKGQGYDRPLRGLDTSFINDPYFNLISIQNYFYGQVFAEPQYTYQALAITWDTNREGQQGTVFYRTHPNSGYSF